MSKNQEFSEEASHVIDLVENSHKNLFVTGKAGTGKSTLLEHLRTLPEQKMIVLAPTGIAAINVSGETIHSFFKLKPGYELDEAKNMRINPTTAAKYEALKTIMIDEISMVRADLLDAVDVFLQRARKNQFPFGGVRMIFFGDLFQLPPVVTRDDKHAFFSLYTSPYFFSAEVFQQKDLFSEGFKIETIELTKIYRQKDKELIDVLNAIRFNSVNDEQLDFINQRVNSNYSSDKGTGDIHLMATNAQALNLNMKRLSEIDSEPQEFHSYSEGKIGKLEPNDRKIAVKKGAQVMFINNDQFKRWVNGTIGQVTGFDEDIDPESMESNPVLLVKIQNGAQVRVTANTWEISKYKFSRGVFSREQIGFFTQIPIKLAWAITIHKSQGKTFEQVVIDLGKGSFAHGQTYVALSRCTSLEGLTLKQPIRQSDVIVDPAISEFSMEINKD